MIQLGSHKRELYDPFAFFKPKPVATRWLLALGISEDWFVCVENRQTFDNKFYYLYTLTDSAEWLKILQKQCNLHDQTRLLEVFCLFEYIRCLNKNKIICFNSRILSPDLLHVVGRDSGGGLRWGRIHPETWLMGLSRFVFGPPTVCFSLCLRLFKAFQSITWRSVCWLKWRVFLQQSVKKKNIIYIGFYNF